MSTRAETVEFLTDQLGALPNIRSKRMFGEYALYCDEKVVAFVCDDELFIKPTDAGRAYIGEPEEAPAYPGSKMYFRVSGDRWEDRERRAERGVSQVEVSKPRQVSGFRLAGSRNRRKGASLNRRKGASLNRVSTTGVRFEYARSRLKRTLVDGEED